MKNIRKNKTNQEVKWSTSALFTIQELWTLNPAFKEITLRVRLTKEIEAGKIAEIGSIPGGKGRPLKVFSLTPITNLTLERARAKGINLVDNAYSIFNVVSVTPSSQPSTLASTPSAVPASAVK